MNKQDRLRRMYQDGLVSPTWDQPWHENDPGLRLDDAGRREAERTIAHPLPEWYAQQRLRNFVFR
jgi:hypothetical protein